MNKVILTGTSLTLDDVIAVARKHALVEIAPEQIEAVKASREIVDRIVEEERVVYGVTTGFGSLCKVSISKEECAQLQENLIRTHSSGFGNPLTEDEARAAMLIRVNSLVKGVSGIRLETIETLLNMLNKNVIPFIPEKGSLGASGDLAPLAHMVLPMLGLGKAYYNGELMSGKEAMEKAGITPICDPIRGGTDGSKISFMGIPTPNIFTGVENLHGRHEFACIDDMKKAVEVIVNIVNIEK